MTLLIGGLFGVMQVKYHEDFEKNIKGSKIQVSDEPEMVRVQQVNHLVSQREYKEKDKVAAATAAMGGERRLSNSSKIHATQSSQTGTTLATFFVHIIAII